MTKASELSTRMQGNVAILEIRGDVTASTGEPIEEAYKRVSVAGATKILLRFDPSAYINSGGIAILIGVVSESTKKGQVIRITGLSPHFQKIFGMVGLTRYAQIFPSEDAALASF